MSNGIRLARSLLGAEKQGSGPWRRVMVILHDCGSALLLTVSLLNENWRCPVAKEPGDILCKNGTIEKR
jgi:hypothetical protein